MDTPGSRTDPIAVAAAVTALIGVALWLTVAGWAGLLAATLSLVLGFLALSRITRNGNKGRVAAYIGIGYGVLNYAVLAASVVRDLIDPIRLS